MSVTTDSQNSKAIVEEFCRVFSTGDVPEILARMSDDATWWVAGTIPGMSGTHQKQPFGALLQGAASVYKGGAMRLTPKSMVAEGDRVAVEAESYAELLDGRVYNNAYHLLFELEAGKVRRVREYMDTVHAHETFIAPAR